MDIRNCKVKYVTKEEAKEITEDMRFCPAYYPHYSESIVLYDGEIGYHPSTNMRYVLKRRK